MRRSISFVLLVALLAVCSPAWGQPAEYGLTLSLRHGIFYPPLKWVPLRIEVRNRSARPIDGYVDMPIEGEGMAVTLRVPVNVPAHSRVTQTAYGYFPAEVAMSAHDRQENRTPPVTVAELHSGDGAVRAREPLVARPLTAGESLPTVVDSPATSLLLDDGYMDSRAYSPEDFNLTLQQVRGYASMLFSLNTDQFPRHRAAVDGVRVVLLGNIDPDALDPAQRQVLLEFIRGGGVLVVAAPQVEPIAGSWLAQYLPVRLVGRRLLHEIHYNGQVLPFIEYAPVAEALPGDGQVLVADDHYVHAAYRQMGLGRIIFTSFPFNALERSVASDALWRDLLHTGAPPRDWSLTALPEQRDSLLSRMIGKTVPPWGLAAGVTGGYLLLVAGAQVVLGGVRRPRAFVATLAVAGLLSVGLVVAGFVRASEQMPMGARLATLDMSSEGGGLIQQEIAYVGRTDDNFALRAASNDVTIRVAETFTRGDKPIVAQQPFSVPQARMLQESYQRVWRAEATLPTEMQLAAIARFDADGLKLRIQNELGGRLEMPWLLWNGARLPLGEALPPGESARSASAGDESVLVSGEQKLRRDILAAATAQPDRAMPTSGETTPVLAGFLNEQAVPRLLETTYDDELGLRTQALLRVPLTIEPTPVGQSVRVPDALMRLVLSRASMGVPYDPSRGEWLLTQHESSPSAPFVIGFAPPWQIGLMRPVRATINIDLNAPRHSITLAPRSAPNKAVTWDEAVSVRTATFDLSPADADENGVIWFHMTVRRTNQGAPGDLPTPWHIRWLRMGLEGQVIDSPRRPLPDRPTPQPPRDNRPRQNGRANNS